MNSPDLGDIKFDATNMYREENYTDLKIGSIQKLIPISADGTDDESREVMFMIRTQLMSQAGPLPIQAPVEATTLGEVIEKFPATVKNAVDDMIKEAEAMQREKASRIVVPGGGGGAPAVTLA